MTAAVGRTAAGELVTFAVTDEGVLQVTNGPIIADFSQATLGPTSDPGFASVATHARASTATVVDFEGIVRDCLDSEIRFAGARRLQNILADADAVWSTASGGINNGDGTYTFPTGSTASRAYRDAPTINGANKLWAGRYQIRAAAPGDVGKPVAIRLEGGGPTYPLLGDAYQYTLTDTWQDVGVFGEQEVSDNIASTRLACRRIDASYPTEDVTVELRQAQLIENTGSAINTPGELADSGSGINYNSGLDSVRYFNYQNGVTVAADGKIIEAQGPAISGITFLKEDAATNLFLNTAAPVTQAVATVNATEYTYWIEGTGSMTLSGGATGVVTEGSPVTATASGSTTCTLSGTVTFAQVEAGDKPTSHIPTAGASETRKDDTLSYSNVPAVNETRVEIEGEADSDTDAWDGTVDETGNLEILTVYGVGMRP